MIVIFRLSDPDIPDNMPKAVEDIEERRTLIQSNMDYDIFRPNGQEVSVHVRLLEVISNGVVIANCYVIPKRIWNEPEED